MYTVFPSSPHLHPPCSVLYEFTEHEGWELINFTLMYICLNQLLMWFILHGRSLSVTGSESPQHFWLRSQLSAFVQKKRLEISNWNRLHRIELGEKKRNYNNQLAVRIFQKNTSAVRIFQNAKQFELEYSETLAVRIFQNSMHCTFKFNVFSPF